MGIYGWMQWNKGGSEGGFEVNTMTSSQHIKVLGCILFMSIFFGLFLEKFTDNSEEMSKKIFDFCNLTWNKDILQFYQLIHVQLIYYNVLHKHQVQFQFLHHYRLS